MEQATLNVPMDERIAFAIKKLSTGDNKEEWDYVQHYIALALVKVRDMLELNGGTHVAGMAKGLRFLFELQARAVAKLSKEDFMKDRTIVGEEDFIIPEQEEWPTFPESD